MHDDDDHTASRFKLDPKLAWHHAPVQLPGRVTRVSKTEVAGPRAGLDTRIVFDVVELRKLLALAESSLSHRVVLYNAGVEISLWRTPAGHQFETWTLIASEAKPESTVMDQMIRGSSTR